MNEMCAQYTSHAGILLVDDVSTTGATLNEAAMPLVEAGAASVSAVVFAVAG